MPKINFVTGSKTLRNPVSNNKLTSASKVKKPTVKVKNTVKVNPVKAKPINITQKTSKVTGKPSKTYNLKFGDQNISMQGLSRRQRNEIVNAAAQKLGNTKLSTTLRSINTLTASIMGSITTMETLGNEGEANKMRMAVAAMDSFLEDISKMDKEQLEALAPVLNKIETGLSKLPGTSSSGEPSGTIRI